MQSAQVFKKTGASWTMGLLLDIENGKVKASLGVQKREQVAVGPGFLKHHILYILCMG